MSIYKSQRYHTFVMHKKRTQRKIKLPHTHKKKPLGVLCFLFSGQNCSESCCSCSGFVMEANSPEMLLKSCLQYMSCACVTFFTRLALTQAGSSGTRRERPNFRSKSTCSIMRIAASPGSIFHLPSRSYKHTKSAEFVHMDVTTRN